MLLFYVRHGDPIYNPDQLTPLGRRQAEAIGRRLARFGVDKVYCSTSVRARQTSEPLCELLRTQPTELEWCHETRAYEDIWVDDGENGRRWAIDSVKYRQLFVTEEMRRLGNEWYEHPDLAQYRDRMKAGKERVDRGVDDFLRELGFEHDRKTGIYQVNNPQHERVALFAHAGFGRAFLSSVLDWPYPDFATHVDMPHSGLSVVEFRPEGDWCIPRLLTYSNDAHLYADDLPTRYNYRISF